MLNKKAAATITFLSVFTIAAVLITANTLFAIYTKEPIVKEVKLGENALKILENQNKFQKNMYLLDSVAEYAINEPLIKTGIDGGLSGEDCKQGEFYKWSKECKPENVKKVFLRNYEDRFLDYMGYYPEMTADYAFRFDENKLIIESKDEITKGTYDEPITTNEGFLSESNQYNEIIEEAGRTYNIDPAVIKAIIKKESNFDPDAKSKKDAYGLMQIKEIAYQDVKAWKEYNINWSFEDAKYNPRHNILTGTAYFKLLKEKYGIKDLRLQLSAYNAGLSVKSLHPSRIPNVAYVDGILGSYNKFSEGEFITAEDIKPGVKITQSAKIFSKVNFDYDFQDYDNIYLQVESCAEKEDFQECTFESLGYDWRISGGENLKLIEVTTDKTVEVVENDKLVEKPIIIRALVGLDSFKS